MGWFEDFRNWRGNQMLDVPAAKAKKIVNTPFGFGRYPEHYNPRVHGPYVPHRYYGPGPLNDTKFFDIKLKDLPAWIGRRDKSFSSFVSLCTRGFYRYMFTWVHVKNTGIVPLFHYSFFFGLIGFLFTYHARTYERHAKYH